MAMQSKLNRILIFFLLVFTLSCAYSVKNYDQVDTQNSTNQEDVILTSWKLDSLGCDGVRSEELAEKLLRTYKLDQQNIKQFINVLGPPNKVDTINNVLYLQYWFDRICQENLGEEADYCLVEFVFISGALSRKRYICI